jgi:uncharacterized protein (TIGR00369 family)
MSIWKRPISVELLNSVNRQSAVTHLGIEITDFGDDYIVGRVPVDHRTIQPYGLIHGGVSVVLAETLGSVAANWAAPVEQQWVGLDINANHLRGVRTGWVTGTCKSVYRGSTTQVWQIELCDDSGKLTCVARLTMAMLRARPTPP